MLKRLLAAFFQVLLITLLLSVFALAKGEYRVFELVLSETPATPETPSAVKERKFLSNLDPQQYVGYYPLKKNQSLRYTATWMCPGRTDYFTPYCANPNLQQQPTALPAQPTDQPPAQPPTRTPAESPAQAPEQTPPP